MLREADRAALLTFIGTALIKFASGIIAVWGTINIYFFSYLHHQGESITPKTNSIILLCSIIPSAFAMLASTTLAKMFGYKTVIKVCGLIFALTPFIINIKINTFTLGLCYLLIPVSCISISSVSVLNCLWSQFPGHLNKVSGSTVLFFSLGAIAFNLIFASTANPNNQKAVINPDGQAFFSTEVSSNIFRASNLMYTLSGISFMIGSFLVSKREQVKPESSNQLSQQNSPVELSYQNEDIPKVSTASIQQIIPLKQALLDKRFIILFIISYIAPQYLIYLSLNMKLIFMPIVNDDHYLATCAIIVTVSAIVAAPFWGYVGDLKGFKTTLLIIILADVAAKVVGIFCTEKWNIVILYFLLSFNDKGILTIIGPGLIQMFGLETATQLIPYKGLSMFFAYITVPLFQLLLSSFVEYRFILVLFLTFTGVALGLALYFYSKIDYLKRDEPERAKESRQFQQRDIDSYLP